MKMSLPRTLTAVALSAGLTLPAMAASTAMIAVTLDTAFIEMTPGTGNGYALPDGFSSPFSFDLAPGDTLDLTIDFSGDQTVTIEGLDSIWAFSYASPDTSVGGTGRFQFLGIDGSVILESVQKTNVEGMGHFGQTFLASDFLELPTSITFGGVRYVGTVLEYIEPGVLSRNHAEPGFSFSADSFTTVVPEPGTWALMLAGVGVLAAALRRRR